MTIKGIGIDIISISRMEDAIENAGTYFLNRVFTPWEQENSEKHGGLFTYYAVRFAGKEAIFKAFGTNWSTGIEFTEIEIREGRFGEPTPVLSGRFAEMAEERGTNSVLLSLSYDGDYAIALATLVADTQ